MENPSVIVGSFCVYVGHMVVQHRYTSIYIIPQLFTLMPILGEVLSPLNKGRGLCSWIGFNCLNAEEPVRKDSLTAKSPGVPKGR